MAASTLPQDPESSTDRQRRRYQGTYRPDFNADNSGVIKKEALTSQNPVLRAPAPETSKVDTRKIERNEAGDFITRPAAGTSDLSSYLAANEQQAAKLPDHDVPLTQREGDPDLAPGSQPVQQTGGGGSNNGPSRTVQSWILGMLITSVLGISLPTFGLFNNFLPDIKSLLAFHNPNRISAQSQRAGKLLGEKMFKTPELCGDTLLCRLKNRGVGLSNKEIGRMRSVGLEPKTTEWDVNGKKFNVLDEIEFNGSRIPPEEFPTFYAKNAGFRSAMWASRSPIRAFAYRGVAAVGKFLKMGINRGIGALVDTIKGWRDRIVRPPSDVAAESPTQDEQQKVDDEIKNGNEAIQKAAADQTGDAGPNVFQGDPTTLDGPVTSKTADFFAGSKTIAGGIKGVMLGFFNIYVTACMVREFITVYVDAAKVLRVLALGNFASQYLTNADAIKTGKATSANINFIANTLITPSSDPATRGMTSANSNLFSYYVDDGKVQNPANLAWMVIGTPALDAMTGIAQFLSDVGANNKNCNIATNWLVQLGFMGANVVSTFLSDGAAAAVGAGASAIAQIKAFELLGSLAKIFAPSLIQFAAGTIAPDPNDPRHSLINGEGLASGMGALDSQLSSASGLQPLTQAQAVAVGNESNAQMAIIKQMDHMGQNPFSPDSPDSIENRLALALFPYLAAPTSQPDIQNLASLAMSPFSLVSNAVNQLFTQQAHAAADTGSAYCQDDAVKTMGLSTDPYCNIDYGMSTADLTKYTNDEVDTYMVNNNYLDATGAPAAGSDFETYLNTCVLNVHGYSPEGDEGSGVNTNLCTGRNGEDPKKLTMFRLFTQDTNLLGSMDAFDSDTLGQDATAASFFNAGQ
ncbi:MAG TPA: hypothetical protein VNG90_02595 [Candidatus Acidoferrum sp.]|nr:hypothetical protein [Candidatus Acidoferrum sp.]